MIRLKLEQLLAEKNFSMYQLHKVTGIRPNTISDMVNNRAKQWSPENLDKIYKALGLSSIDELIEYVEDDSDSERKE